jgi:N-acetylmuramic acid 6-phosphate etherase
MVDDQLPNEKLRARAVRMVAHAASAAAPVASAALAAAEGDTRVAILMLMRGLAVKEARMRLEAHSRNLRLALDEELEAPGVSDE